MTPRVNGPHFVHPFIMEMPLGCFHLSVTVSDAAVNTGAQVSVPVPTFTPLRIHLELLNHSVPPLEELPDCLHNSCSHFTSPPTAYTVPVSSYSPYSLQHWLFYLFFVLVWSSKVALHVVLICISLLLVMHICMSSWEISFCSDYFGIHILFYLFKIKFWILKQKKVLDAKKII